MENKILNLCQVENGEVIENVVLDGHIARFMREEECEMFNKTVKMQREHTSIAFPLNDTQIVLVDDTDDEGVLYDITSMRMAS